MKTVDRDVGFLLGLPFHVITMEETIEDAVAQIESRDPAYYITANADFIAQAHGNEALKDILFHAHRVVCDGMPLVWLSRYFKPVLPERVAGSDMVFRLFEKADSHKWRVYFLGSDEATLKKTKSILAEEYPGMEVVGTFSPPFGSADSWPNQTILREIDSTRPDLLLVAVGCPKQEYWIARYYRRTGVPLSIGIGASLDFICGKQTRAPHWVQRLGMEWGWRLMTNPKRLFKRYAKDFYYLLLLGYRQRKLMVQRRRTGGIALRTEPARAPVAPTRQAPGNKESRAHWIKWIGEVERATIESLDEPEDYAKPVFLDLGQVSFIDSSGIGVLAKIARQARAAEIGFGLLRPSEPVARILDAMHLEAQFPVYADESEALASLSGSGPTAPQPTQRLTLAAPFGRREHAASLAQLRKAVDQTNIGECLELDLSAVELIDSFAMSRLLEAYRTLHAKKAALKVVGASEQAWQAMRMTGVSQILTGEVFHG